VVASLTYPLCILAIAIGKVVPQKEPGQATCAICTCCRTWFGYAHRLAFAKAYPAICLPSAMPSGMPWLGTPSNSASRRPDKSSAARSHGSPGLRQRNPQPLRPRSHRYQRRRTPNRARDVINRADATGDSDGQFVNSCSDALNRPTPDREPQTAHDPPRVAVKVDIGKGTRATWQTSPAALYSAGPGRGRAAFHGTRSDPARQLHGWLVGVFPHALTTTGLGDRYGWSAGAPAPSLRVLVGDQSLPRPGVSSAAQRG
jgi:hypothetical protein